MEFKCFFLLCSFLPKHKGNGFYKKVNYGEAYLSCAYLYFKMYFRVLTATVWYKWAQSISKSERLMCDQSCFCFFPVVSYNLTKVQLIFQFSQEKKKKKIKCVLTFSAKITAAKVIFPSLGLSGKKEGRLSSRKQEHGFFRLIKGISTSRVHLEICYICSRQQLCISVFFCIY